MRWSKFSLVVLISSLLTPIFAYASVSSIISNVFDTIISIGSLSFLGFPGGDDITSFLRILIFILTFTIYFTVLTAANGFLKIFQRNIAIVIALILSIITTIFIPSTVMIASGTALGTLVSVALLAAPLLGILALIFFLPDRPCWWWLVKLFIAVILYWVSTQTQNYLADPAFSFSTNVAASLAGFWEWILFIEFLIILYLIYKLLTCGDDETGIPLNPKELLDRIKRIINPNAPDPGRDDPDGEEDHSPPPPPNPGAKPPNSNEGDNPIPPDNPKLNEPKHKPIPGTPFYKPKKPKPPKEKRIKIDLSPWFLSVRNQDGLGACAAFAGSSIMEYIINRISGYLNYDYKLSELFLWYNAREDKNSNSGTWPVDLMNELLKQGDCKEKLWSFEGVTSTKYLQMPLQNCFQDALQQRALSVKNVSTDPDEWIRILLDEHPLYFGIGVPQNFGKAYLTGKPLYEKIIWPTKGGHGMVIVGYDSHYPTPDGRKIEAFKVRNSWGELFGEGGYIWIPRILLRNMINKQGDTLYIIDGWNNKKGDKQLYTIKGRAVFDDKRFKGFPAVPKQWTGHQIVKSSKISAPNDHAFKVAVMAQIQGRPVFLPEAETVVQTGQNGMFKLQFTADPTQFQKLTQFPEAFPQLKGVDFSKQAPGLIVVKKPYMEENSDMHQWFFHVAQFKYSHAGRGGEGHHEPTNPRSDIASKTKIHFSGRPIQFGPNHDTEENVVIPVMFYEENKTENEEDEEKKKHKAKLALERIHKHAKKELDWTMRESDLLVGLEPSLLAQDIKAFRRLDSRINQASRRIYREFVTLKKTISHETKSLPSGLNKKLSGKLEQLSVAEKNFILFLQSSDPIQTSENPKQLSVEAAKKYLQKHHNDESKKQEVEQAWIDLSFSFKDLKKWLAAMVTTLEDVVELSGEKKAK
ncbi:hypothetical protein CL619_00935 [archaeon]|nr:hypothetical protein [archaeon]|tara:strand:- start:5316 stop:8075 length:2760 start_codon:yes stop_codon:yes gene_type:complete